MLLSWLYFSSCDKVPDGKQLEWGSIGIGFQQTVHDAGKKQWLQVQTASHNLSSQGKKNPVKDKCIHAARILDFFTLTRFTNASMLPAF